ncbi:ATP-binding protein [Gilvimarinus sp. F26214L]|uniref:ATP-binding protein n=1 Tax=Gilvimarinus sp. DZF01 TaxID=3461371 RepID=UPI0040463BED
MPRSLAGRLLLASVLLLPVLLGVSAYMLDLAFRRSLLSAEEDRLRGHVYLLLSVAELNDGNLWMPEVLQEPRLNQIDSGLYGWITDQSERPLWRSPSAALLETVEMPARSFQPGTGHFGELNTRLGPLFAYSLDVVWQAGTQDHGMRVVVLHNPTALQAEQDAYRGQLWRWLGLLAVLLTGVQVLILRWGLKPLRGLAADLKRIESGARTQLAGSYPREIQTVTDNLNRVLKSELQQRERYRHTMDDLAHSLKTPLAVIQGSLEARTASGGVVEEQLERMKQIIDHQLKRAVVNQAVPRHRASAIEPVVQRLLNALDKVYRDKQVSARLTASQCTSTVDERDLFELLGNLLENAFKYCRGQVLVTAESSRNGVTIRIEDDGPGVPAAQRHTILERGARADTANSGQGIGLAVAVDIISSYGGSLAVERSPLGGACFSLLLPA